ncbi:transcription termination factor Rho [Eisenbergiella sp. OF01-20]|nr:transcription termination factor Rho [Eisenbergiella sp. OF01-20]MBS5533753.1 transcription termination factor Rho [Lachnospiraceae bacterium]RHP86516.1 transcription termination factor Rho [Eisenbergiella sp. OF01-20]
MREKYQSLALADLKEIAKTRGIKGTSGMKKADIIEAMVALDEKEGKDQAAAPGAETKEETAVKPKTANESKKSTRGKAADVKTADTKAAEGKKAEPAENAKAQEQPAVEKSPVPSQPAAAPRTAPRAESQGSASSVSQTATQSVPQNRNNMDRKPVRRDNGNRKNGDNRPGGNQRSIIINSDGRQNTPAVQGGERPSFTERPANAARTENRNTAAERTDNSQAEIPVPSITEDEKFPSDLDSGIAANGILEVMPDGYGFIRCANYLPGENDVYVAPSQIRRFGLKTGDIVVGNTRIKTQNEKFSALLYVKSINGYAPDVAARRQNFEDMTPIFPEERVRLEMSRSSVAMRIMDLMSPVGKGQRGMIVSPPKAGKTTLLKQVAQSVKVNNPDMHLIILLIDERPEEVTDFREAIEGPNVEVIYSTFDELPEHHKRVSEMVIERAKRLVEHKKDVIILLDSITRLTRAYNLVIPPSGRTLSGGLDPAALHMPKRFFGAARNMREGGSLTILATALVDTGSKMDDVIYEEFKGTGNMEIVLDRKLSERRVFPAIDIPKSGTRREDLLLTPEELEAIGILRKALNSLRPEDAVDKILDMFARTKNNVDFVNLVKKMKFI